MFSKEFAMAAIALACAGEAFAFQVPCGSFAATQLRTHGTTISRVPAHGAAPRSTRIVSRRINGGHARPGEPPAKRSAFDSLVLRSGLALRMTGTGKLAQKYGHLRGAEVEPCDKSVQRFYEIFGKPVPFVFRSATNEILYLSHLDVVNARFEYDVVWATGLFSTCDVFFQGIEESLRLELFNALIKALKLDPVKVKADAESVLVWAQGKNEGDVVKAMNGEDTSEIGKVLSKAKSSDEDDFLYTRNFGAGLIKIMQVVGTEPNSANAKKWAEAMSFRQNESAMTGLSMSRFEGDVGVFLSAVEKFQQIIQLYAEVEAREKKKVAERLAEKAERAAQDAA